MEIVSPWEEEDGLDLSLWGSSLKVILINGDNTRLLLLRDFIATRDGLLSVELKKKPAWAGEEETDLICGDATAAATGTNSSQ